MKCLLIPLLASLALPSSVEANWFGKYGSVEDSNTISPVQILLKDTALIQLIVPKENYIKYNWQWI